MIRKRTIFAYSLCATLGLLSTSGAYAGCPLAGTWHFMAFQGSSPDIKSTTATVKNSSNANVQIRVFSNTGQAFTNGTSRVIKCTVTLAANGTFSNDPCTSYGVEGGAAQTPTVSGKITATACNLTGTVKVQGDPTPVTIRAGHMNGSSGAGIATQGAKQVLYFTLIKN